MDGMDIRENWLTLEDDEKVFYITMCHYDVVEDRVHNCWHYKNSVEYYFRFYSNSYLGAGSVTDEHISTLDIEKLDAGTQRVLNGIENKYCFVCENGTWNITLTKESSGFSVFFEKHDGIFDWIRFNLSDLDMAEFKQICDVFASWKRYYPVLDEGTLCTDYWLWPGNTDFDPSQNPQPEKETYIATEEDEFWNDFFKRCEEEIDLDFE